MPGTSQNVYGAVVHLRINLLDANVLRGKGFRLKSLGHRDYFASDIRSGGLIAEMSSKTTAVEKRPLVAELTDRHGLFEFRGPRDWPNGRRTRVTVGLPCDASFVTRSDDGYDFTRVIHNSVSDKRDDHARWDVAGISDASV